MKEAFSVVIPAYNEEKYLRVTLPSVCQLNPEEVIIILDRPKDRSEEVIKRICKKFETNTRIEIINEEVDWKLRQAYLRNYGFDIANNDTILSTDADFYLDKNISHYIKNIKNKKYGLISFGILDYPLNYRSIISVILSKIFKQKTFAGPILFSKKAWLETKDQELKNWWSGEDIYIRRKISRKYPVKHIYTNTWHLRPQDNTLKDYEGGIFYYNNLKSRSKIKMFLLSLILLKPHLFAGFMYAFNKKVNNSSNR